MIKAITELAGKELFGKKVLLRVDFNVPVEGGNISETYRFKVNKEAVDFLARNGAIIVLISHITAIAGFEPIVKEAESNLGHNFVFVKNFEELEQKLTVAKPGEIFLLDNIRQYDGEEKNNAAFAEKLAKPFDIYVNNAFSVSHRNHASITGIVKFIPSYGGPLLMKEIENLSRAIELPSQEKTLIIGGGKAGTKLPVIENFLDKAEHILIGGVIANVFLKASGMDIGKSIIDDEYLPRAKKYLKIHRELAIPEDFTIRNEMILDIGPKTISKFRDIIIKSKTIVWNGPLGKAEIPEFSLGTKKIAEAIVESGAFSIVGGGDTIAVLEELDIIKKINYVSPSGGAMLEFLAGNRLPGLKALGCYV
ncbi:phosphoglycerate kinase [Candidatus Wolfebacteria bacterium]|nr:phosphoglycerate kinase [Candidatus Wolfebacteria bacterium]